MRERHGEQVILVGMTTYQGTVTAASCWDGVAERKRVRPALDGSVEAAFHRSGIRQFMLPLRSMDTVTKNQFGRQLERAIGVIYHPATERKSHYFYTSLPQQFDAVLHLTPLEIGTEWKAGEVPETYPVGV
jgi:erythromycin esterase-like protein